MIINRPYLRLAKHIILGLSWKHLISSTFCSVFLIYSVQYNLHFKLKSTNLYIYLISFGLKLLFHPIYIEILIHINRGQIKVITTSVQLMIQGLNILDSITIWMRIVLTTLSDTHVRMNFLDYRCFMIATQPIKIYTSQIN